VVVVVGRGFGFVVSEQCVKGVVCTILGRKRTPTPRWFSVCTFPWPSPIPVPLVHPRAPRPSPCPSPIPVPFAHPRVPVALPLPRALPLPQAAGATVVDSEGTSKLPRLHVCFSSEDPVNFAHRVGVAHRTRSQAASLLRYNLYIDCMPTDDAPKLDAEQCSRVVGSAINSKALQVRRPRRCCPVSPLPSHPCTRLRAAREGCGVMAG
jgi:hypothetical protein